MFFDVSQFSFLPLDQLVVNQGVAGLILCMAIIFS